MIILTLFAVSAFTRGAAPETLDRLTVNWGGAPEVFRRITDWRIELAILTVITILLYAWSW